MTTFLYADVKMFSAFTRDLGSAIKANLTAGSS